MSRACRMPVVSLIAWGERTPSRFIFVRVPNEHGRYMRTDKSVALAPCELCNATVGEPCKHKGKYHAGTHAVRRRAADGRRDKKLAEQPDDVVDHLDGASVTVKCG